MSSQPRRLPSLLLGLALVPLAACADDGGGDDEAGGCTENQEMRIDDVLGLDGDAAAGATVFSNSCGNAGCHGADGIEGPAPDLPDRVPDFMTDGLACVVIGGTGSMPPQSSLSDQEIADVLAYVQDTF